MKLVPFSLGILLAFRATAALAQGGNNLAWDDCLGSGYEVYDKVAACANTGSFFLIASFVPGVRIDDLGGCQWALQLQTRSSIIDPWWTGNGMFWRRWIYNKDNPTAVACQGEVWNTAPSVSIPASFF